jgi:AcrR family transcriptional regulator
MDAHRTKHGAARVRSLTDAAADMFLDQGYEAMSLDALIARVGGSRRNIYSHFGGKEGLFIEVVTRLCADLARPLEGLEISSEGVKDALTIFGSHLLEIVLQSRTLALHRLMIAEGQRFPALAQAIWQSGHDNAARILIPWIEHKQSSNQLRADLPAKDLAGQFVNLVVTEPQLRNLVGFIPDPCQSTENTQIVERAVVLFLAGALIQKGDINA